MKNFDLVIMKCVGSMANYYKFLKYLLLWHEVSVGFHSFKNYLTYENFMFLDNILGINEHNSTIIYCYQTKNYSFIG